MSLLLSEDQATVDRAAVGVPSVIDALVAQVPVGLRTELELLSPGMDTSWFEREGDDGLFVLAASCRKEVAALQGYWGDAWARVINRMRLLMERFASRPLGPWLWVELLGAAPHRYIAGELWRAGSAFHGHLPALRAGIRAKVTVRKWLFDQLERAGALTVEDTLDWLRDPPLRPSCEAFLRDHVVDIESRLRELVADTTPGAREAIVRLLRTIDNRIDQAGETPGTNLAELEARMRVDPTDEVTAQVWADLMQEAGDPRGHLLALDLAIAQAPDPARKLALSGERATVFADHRKQILGKPSGWPFREKYLGRGYIAFGSSRRGMIRGKPTTRQDRVMRFFAELTDVETPPLAGHVMETTFKLTWPNTRTALPYQEPGHYPQAIESSLKINLASGGLQLGLVFPFESFEDPLFVLMYDAVADALGKIVLTPTGFSTFVPTVDGKKLKSKITRYRGPATDA